MPTWLMQGQSLLIVLLMLVGVQFARKHKRAQHVKIMAFAMLWDILLILQIQLDRSAVQKAAKALTNPMMLNIHVSIAVSTVVFYIFMVLSGRKVLAGMTSALPKHKFLGQITLILRILTLITSFWAVPTSL